MTSKTQHPIRTPEVVLRTNAAAVVVRLSLAAALVAVAVTACAHPAATTAAAGAPTPAAVVTAAADDSIAHRAHDIADSLRTLLLTRADWSDAPDSCDPGVLRTFSADTTSALQGQTARQIARLEEIVVAYGLDTPLDTRDGRDLLREVVAWEAGGGNMRWDAESGTTDRRALAPGLGGRFRNPQTKRCERYVQSDAATIVIPAVGGFTQPMVTGVKLQVLAGEPALAAARASAAGKPLSYVRLGPVVLWRDYAVVTTRRVTEPGESAATGGAAAADVGNASYVLHRGADGWRLLVIARTW